MKTYTCPTILIVIGVILFIISVVVPMIFPSILDSKLEAKLIIAPDSEMLEKFTNSPVPYSLEITFFNVTNAEDVLYGEKPILKEVGPYTYTFKKNKDDPIFHHNNGTIGFKLRKTYFFDQERSKGNLTDLITTINPVFMSLAKKLDGMSGFKRTLMESSLMDPDYEPFMTQSVENILFEGYDEPIVDALFDLTGKEKYAEGKFGYFYLKNGTTPVTMDMVTGELGMSNYQGIVKFQGKLKLNYWKTDECNTLKGTDAAQFPRPVTQDDKLYFFVSDLCRTLYATYEKDVYLGSLKLYRFVLPQEVLAQNSSSCYCRDEFTCRWSMVDVSQCRDGAPILISTPHFYQGLQEDVDDVVGLNPTKDKHETYLDIEPNTGITFRAAKRIQINAAVRPYSNYQLMDVSEHILPVLWVSETAVAPIESAEGLHKKLTVPVTVVSYGSWALFGVSLVMLLIGSVLLIKILKNYLTKRRRPVEIGEENETCLKM